MGHVCLVYPIQVLTGVNKRLTYSTTITNQYIKNSNQNILYPNTIYLFRCSTTLDKPSTRYKSFLRRLRSCLWDRLSWAVNSSLYACFPIDFNRVTFALNVTLILYGVRVLFPNFTNNSKMLRLEPKCLNMAYKISYVAYPYYVWIIWFYWNMWIQSVRLCGLIFTINMMQVTL